MKNLLSQIVQMDLNLLYGFVLLDEKEQALESIEVMVQLARYLGRPEGSAISLEDENNHLFELIQLSNLKIPGKFSLDIEVEGKDKNIYIERFSVFNVIAPLIIKENEMGERFYKLKYRQDETSLRVKFFLGDQKKLEFTVKNI